MVVPDYMHVVCLGILQPLSGNLLWDCFESLGGVHSNPQAALSKLMNCLNVSARALGEECPIWNLTISMIRTKMSEAPKLKAKAAEGRHLIFIIAHLLRHSFDLVTEHELTRYRCADCLVKIYKEFKQLRTVIKCQ